MILNKAINKSKIFSAERFKGKIAAWEGGLQLITRTFW
jgi:hypothetical protein